jgi:hypothetical protein
MKPEARMLWAIAVMVFLFGMVILGSLFQIIFTLNSLFSVVKDIRKLQADLLVKLFESEDVAAVESKDAGASQIQKKPIALAPGRAVFGLENTTKLPRGDK